MPRVRGQPAERTDDGRRLAKRVVFRDRAPLLGKTLALGMCFAQTASAEPSPWLHWSPPPECPTASDIERRVAEWLGGPFPTNTDIAVRTALGWNGERWEVTVEIAFDGQSGKRQVNVRDCQEAADFVAIAVALAVDPSLAERMNPAAPEATGADAEPNPKLDPRPREAVKRRPSRAQTSTPNAARSDATMPALKAASDEGSPFRPHASASAEGTMGVLPSPSLGVGVALGGDIGRLSFGLSARWFPAQSSTPEQAAAPIDFSLLSGRVGAAYLFFGPEARLGPSLAFDAGAIRAHQLRSEDDGVVEPLLSLAGGVLGLVALTAYVSVFGEFELAIPLTRPSFLLSDQSVVYQVGTGVRAAVGLRFFFVGQ